MFKTQMFIAGALLAGVAIGYFAGGHGDAAKLADVREEYVAKKAVSDSGEAASLKALRRRVAELEKLLAEKSEKSEVVISNAVAEAVKNRPPEPPLQNWRERMEEMRKNNPEEYARRTNWWAQVRRSRAERARNKIDFLSSIDTSRMSAGARKTHDALQELLARREEVEAQLQDPNLSDEERDKLMGELRSSRHELMRLNGEERRNLIDEAARNMGFEGEDAKEISATIREVIEVTDSGWGGPHHGGHHGGPRPGNLGRH